MRVILAHAVQHFLRCLSGQAVERDQLVRGTCCRFRQPCTEFCHCVARCPVALRAARKGSCKFALPACFLHLFTICRRTGKIARQNIRCGMEPRKVKFCPFRPQTRHGRLLVFRQQRRNRVEQRGFLHPDASKSIKRQDGAHLPRRANICPPRFLGRDILAWGAHLVEQYHDRLANPAQHLHLQIDISCAGRVFRSIDEVKDYVSFIACVLDGLLARPQGAFPPPVPHLADEPANRVAGIFQARKKPRSIAETRRVPQHQRIFPMLHQHIACGKIGHMRCVAHFADIAAQQCPRKRGFASIGMADQAEIDRNAVTTWAAVISFVKAHAFSSSGRIKFASIFLASTSPGASDNSMPIGNIPSGASMLRHCASRVSTRSSSPVWPAKCVR